MKEGYLAKKLTRKVVRGDLWVQYSRDLRVKYKADQIVYLVQHIATALNPLFWAIAGAYIKSFIFKNREDRDFSRRFREAYEKYAADDLKEVKANLKKLENFIHKNPNKADSGYRKTLDRYKSAVREIDSPLKAKKLIKRIRYKKKGK